MKRGDMWKAMETDRRFSEWVATIGKRRKENESGSMKTIAGGNDDWETCGGLDESVTCVMRWP